MIDQGRGGDGTVQVMFEYYTRVFDLLHQSYNRSEAGKIRNHPIRERFWRHVPNGVYYQRKSTELLHSYFNVTRK